MSRTRVVETNECTPAACGKKPRRMLCAHVSGRVFQIKKLITFLLFATHRTGLGTADESDVRDSHLADAGDIA
jgi:hypothetical protein